MFVNSIKTARRLDGLLRALGLNCRTVHSQLQQRQRLRALDSFRSSPIGVLVATDIAARGLDIPKVEFVVHYDIARSTQVLYFKLDIPMNRRSYCLGMILYRNRFMYIVLEEPLELLPKGLLFR